MISAIALGLAVAALVVAGFTFINASIQTAAARVIENMPNDVEVQEVDEVDEAAGTKPNGTVH